MINRITDSVRGWLIGVFANAVVKTTRAEDRTAAIQWLGQSRDIVASELGTAEKLRKLNSLMSSRTAAIVVARSVCETVTNYRHSKLPLSVKVAIPATLAAIPVVGLQGAGIAAFGGAIGAPVLLLIFLGAAGITAVIESIVTNPDSRTDIADIINVIIEDERLRRASDELKAAMREQPADAMRSSVPANEIALRQHLHSMNPFLFEQHVMSFFATAGLEAWTTRKSNDMGVDGFAVHSDGAIIVQCKRNAADNKVGRPTVQQFKGVVEEQNAVRGYIVTTSTFTAEARQSALLSQKLVLIDIDELVAWHTETPTFH